MRGFDFAVIGAGIVGLATATALLHRHPRARLVVLEKEAGPARHQSGHNSGVIHSGVYYTPGSLKARLCVEGGRRVIEYCDARAIPVGRCGKLIVAVDDRELPRLAELHRRGERNGVPGLAILGPAEMREIEPNVRGLRALHVPSAAIVDFARVTASLADDLHAAGGEVRYRSGVVSIAQAAGEVRIGTRGGGGVVADRVVICAGLHADRLARLAGGPPEPRIVPFRGDYYVLRPERTGLVRGLVYPVPDPQLPFLGVHVTPRIDGSVWLGPNAVLAFAREGYRWRDVSLDDMRDALLHPELARMARRHWAAGLAEVRRSLSRGAFIAAARRLVPSLAESDVVRGPSGVRAQAIAADGTLLDDFVIDAIGRVTCLRNAPSPAATSALAIGEEIAERVAAA